MSTADSSRALSSAAFISTEAASAAARSFLADSMASPMVFSRSSIIWRMGPQANLPSTMMSNPKVSAVQKLRAKFTSVRPGARRISGSRVYSRVRLGTGRGTPSSGAPAPCVVSPSRAWLHLDGEDDADHLGEERDAFDERGRDDHRGADVARRRRLAGGAFHGGGGEAADAPAGAQHRQSGSKSCSEIPQREWIHCQSLLLLSMPRAPATRSGKLSRGMDPRPP